MNDQTVWKSATINPSDLLVRERETETNKERKRLMMWQKMGRKPCCSKEVVMNRGAWTAQEDKILREYIQVHGEGRWKKVSQKSGLRRNGNSCRLRWLNYLRPDIKKGNISADEEELIIRLHKLLGNRWSLIAGRLPGRTDNEIKNYWKTHLCKKMDLQCSSSASKSKHQSSQKLGSHVIRTKAVKCSGVFINPQPMKPGNSDEEGGDCRMGGDSDPFLIPNITNDEEPAFGSQENNQSDFLLDFNVDLCSLDHIDFEFSELCNY